MWPSRILSFPHRGMGLVEAWASLIAQLVKNPPAMWETWVQSLGWEDSPEEAKGYPLQYSGEFHGLYSSWSHKELDMTEQLSLSVVARPFLMVAMPEGSN